LVTQDDDLNRLGSQLVEELGEVNKADGDTLVDFVTWRWTLTRGPLRPESYPTTAWSGRAAGATLAPAGRIPASAVDLPVAGGFDLPLELDDAFAVSGRKPLGEA
jgi:hypothetical protein